MSRVDVTLGVKNAQFKRGMEQAKGQMKSFRNVANKGFSFGQVAGITALLVGLDKLTAKYDKFHALALRLNTDVASIQRLEFISSQNKSNLDELANAITRITRKVADVDSNKGLAKAFKDLNIDAQEFKGLDVEGKIYALSDAFVNAEDEGLAFNRLFTLLEDDAKKLIPLLRLGSAAIRDQADSIKTLTDAEVEQMASARDAIDEAKTHVSGQFASWIGSIILGFKGMVAAATQAGIEITDALSGRGRDGAWERVLDAYDEESSGSGGLGSSSAAGGVRGDFGEILVTEKQRQTLVKERERLEKSIAAEEAKRAALNHTTAQKLETAMARRKELAGELLDIELQLQDMPEGEAKMKLDNERLKKEEEYQKALTKTKEIEKQIAEEKKRQAEEEAKQHRQDYADQRQKELDLLRERESELANQRDSAQRKADAFAGGTDRLQSIGLGAGGINYSQSSEVARQTKLAVERNRQLSELTDEIKQLEITIEEDEFA